MIAAQWAQSSWYSPASNTVQLHLLRAFQAVIGKRADMALSEASHLYALCMVHLPESVRLSTGIAPAYMNLQRQHALIREYATSHHTHRLPQ